MTSGYEQEIQRKRRELTETLEAIEEKLDVGYQARRMKAQTDESIRSNPTPWIATAGAVLLVSGVLAWRLFRR